jgi:hypothetical protein
MKSLVATLLVLAVAVLMILYVLSANIISETETAGIDQTNPSSSYEQKTNHFPRPSYSLGPIQGSPTPYKVNQWESYQV